MVYYKWSGVEGGGMGRNVVGVFHADKCVKLNDGRWFCFIENNWIEIESFLTK